MPVSPPHHAMLHSTLQTGLKLADKLVYLISEFRFIRWCGNLMEEVGGRVVATSPEGINLIHAINPFVYIPVRAVYHCTSISGKLVVDYARNTLAYMAGLEPGHKLMVNAATSLGIYTMRALTQSYKDLRQERLELLMKLAKFYEPSAPTYHPNEPLCEDEKLAAALTDYFKLTPTHRQSHNFVPEPYFKQFFDNILMFFIPSQLSKIVLTHLDNRSLSTIWKGAWPLFKESGYVFVLASVDTRTTNRREASIEEYSSPLEVSEWSNETLKALVLLQEIIKTVHNQEGDVLTNMITLSEEKQLEACENAQSYADYLLDMIPYLFLSTFGYPDGTISRHIVIDYRHAAHMVTQFLKDVKTTDQFDMSKLEEKASQSPTSTSDAIYDALYHYTQIIFAQEFKSEELEKSTKTIQTEQPIEAEAGTEIVTEVEMDTCSFSLNNQNNIFSIQNEMCWND